MAAKLKKEIIALSSVKNDVETVKKDEENKNSIKPLGRLEYICKFPDLNGHLSHHVGEAATISEPLDKRVVEFLKTQIRSGCKRIKKLQRQTSIFVNDVNSTHEEKPESCRKKFTPNNKKIKNLITYAKNETGMFFIFARKIHLLNDLLSHLTCIYLSSL